MRTLSALTLFLLASLALAGCGSGSGSSADDADTATGAATTAQVPTAPASSTTATPPAPSAPQKTDVQAAERVVRDELPNIPIWKGYAFRGRIKNAALICVDRIPPPDDASGLVSHVMVSWPGLQTGEPKDGPCAKAAQTADREAAAAQKFYLDTDDDAIALDIAVSDLQNGRRSALAELDRLAQRLRVRVSNYPDLSYGGNLLLSSAVSAAEEGRSGNPSMRRLASLRRDIAEARASLAKELRG